MDFKAQYEVTHMGLLTSGPQPCCIGRGVQKGGGGLNFHFGVYGHLGIFAISDCRQCASSSKHDAQSIRHNCHDTGIAHSHGPFKAQNNPSCHL